MATGEATAAVLHVSDTCGTVGHHSIKADSIAGTNLNGSNGDGAWSPSQSIRIYRAALVDMVEEGQACCAPLATVLLSSTSMQGNQNHIVYRAP